MKYPTEIRIRGYLYRIEYVENKREVDRDFEDSSYLGTCSATHIRILATQPLLGIMETLIHEILHAILSRNTMLKVAIKRGMEERFITTLASDVALVLLDNNFVKFLKHPPITTRIHPEALP